MKCEGKVATGSVRSLKIKIGNPGCEKESNILPARKRKVRLGMSTGRFFSSQRESNPFEVSQDCGDQLSVIGSSQDLQQLKNMSTKKTPELGSPSSSEVSLSIETPCPIGRSYDHKLKKENWTKYRPIFSVDITGFSKQSKLIIVRRIGGNAKLNAFGAQLEVVNQVALGPKPEKKCILRILARSSGVATEVKRILLSMSSEAGSTFLICLDGWTGTHAQWKLKEEVVPCVDLTGGSPVISTPKAGTPIVID